MEKNKFVGILILFSLFLFMSCFVYGYENILIHTMVSTHDSAGYGNVPYGWNISFNHSGNIINVTKDPDDDALDFRIWDNSFTLVYENLGLDSGNTWFVNQAVTPGKYFFMANNRPGGASATLGYTAPFTPKSFLYGQVNKSYQNVSGSWNEYGNWASLESFYFEPTAGGTSTIDILSSNVTNLNSYKASFDESENFMVYINWTNDADGLAFNTSNGKCNITLFDALGENESAQVVDKTICDNVACDISPSNIEELSLGETLNAVNDSVRIDLCHLQLPQGDISVNFSCQAGTESFIISPTEYPLCSEGFGTVVRVSDVCVSDNKINFTLSSALTFNRRKNISEFEWDREFSVHTMTNETGRVIFNGSSQLWYTVHDHEYYDHGSKNIDVNCSHLSDGNFDNSKRESITIVNQAPIIFIEQVTTDLGDTTLIDNVVVEYAYGNYTFFYAVVDDDVSFLNISISNHSNILFSLQFDNASNDPFNVSSEFFRNAGGNPFNITIMANDTFNDSTELTISFNVSDTTDPVCTGFDDVSVSNNSVYTWAVSCSDESFFSLNVTCEQHINNTEGLNVQNWAFTDSFTVNISNTCVIEYCDGHTDRILGDSFTEVFRNSTLEISNDGLFNRFSAYTDRDTVKVSSVRLKDRISFTYDYRDLREILEPVDKLTLKHRTFFYEGSPRSYYLEDPKYKGWIVDAKAGTWFDANIKNDPDAVVSVQRFNFTHWKVDVSSTENILEFESIGKLNCVSLNQQFTISPGEPDLGSTNEFETIPQAMFHIFMIFLWIVLVVMALYLKGPNGKTIQFFNILQMLVAIVEGTAFIKFSFLVGFPIVFIGVGLFIGLIIDRK